MNEGIIQQFDGNVVAARHNRVTGSMVPRIGGPPVGTLEYQPPPWDLLGSQGAPVAAFQIPYTPI